jgi:DnaJ-class molecular chaperone
MCNEGKRMNLKKKILIYEVCEECHGNGFIRPDRFKDKGIDTTYVCNACRGSGHSGARTKL